MTKSLVLCKVISNFSILFYFFQEPTLDSNGVEIKEPLDTIFVKSVRESGPAHLAGLQCGKYFVEMTSSWNYPAGAEPSYEGAEPSWGTSISELKPS